MTDSPQQDIPPLSPELPADSSGDPQSGKPAVPAVKKQKMVLVRYGKMGQIGFFLNNLREFPAETTHLIISTERGLELGEILLPQAAHKEGQCRIKTERIDQFCASSDSNYPLHREGKVVRIASEADRNEQRHLDINVKQILDQCDGFIQQERLQMKLVDAEHLFGGDRIIFYFMAEGRVDFRHLVKQLAQHFQTRIEMRQIGARDEARLVGDFETCGRECCCKNFLKVLKPVNMRMAKLQKATLDPAKISGRCGRLKCCLRYEDEVYNDLNKRLPRKGSCVKIEDGFGEVVDSQIITQLVRVRMADGKQVAVQVDEILEFNYRPSDEEVRRAEQQPPSRGRRSDSRPPAPERRPAPAVERPLAAVASEPEEGFDAEGLQDAPQTGEPAAGQAGGDPAARKRKRKRRKRKPGGEGQPAGGQAPSAADESAGGEPDEASGPGADGPDVPGSEASGPDGGGARRKRKRRPRNRNRNRTGEPGGAGPAAPDSGPPAGGGE